MQRLACVAHNRDRTPEGRAPPGAEGTPDSISSALPLPQAADPDEGLGLIELVGATNTKLEKTTKAIIR